MISLSQQSYINQILTHFGLDKAKPTLTPMEPGINLTPDSPSVSAMFFTQTEKTTYHEMIGSLMYLSMMTCPDITYAVIHAISVPQLTPYDPPQGCQMSI